MIEVRTLCREDDRSGFCSGNGALDDYLKRFAGQNQFKFQNSVTYLAIEQTKIVGYFTVSTGSLDINDLPDEYRIGLPPYDLPVLRLVRLAVQEDVQRKGIGKRLLYEVVQLARTLAAMVGCSGIFVDAKSDATLFYEKFGFTRITLTKGRLKETQNLTDMYLHCTRFMPLLSSTQTP